MIVVVLVLVLVLVLSLSSLFYLVWYGYTHCINDRTTATLVSQEMEAIVKSSSVVCVQCVVELRYG